MQYRRVGRGGAGNFYSQQDIPKALDIAVEVLNAFISLPKTLTAPRMLEPNHRPPVPWSRMQTGKVKRS